MIQRLHILVFMAFLILPLHVHASEGKAIGSVTFAQGNVKIKEGGSKEPAVLKVGHKIEIGDTILTDENGYAKIEFIDETSIALNGAGGSLHIDEYIFDPENKGANKARFDVLRASFVYVSGLLGKAKKPDVEIDLDFGTIGIRGTKILRAMKEGDECWILLEEGKIRVANNAGAVFLGPGDGTRMSSKSVAPKAPKPWGPKNINWIRGEVALPGEVVEKVEAKVEAKAEDSTVKDVVKDVVKEKETVAPEKPQPPVKTEKPVVETKPIETKVESVEKPQAPAALEKPAETKIQILETPESPTGLEIKVEDPAVVEEDSP